MELKEEFIGCRMYVKGKGLHLIEDTLKGKRLYKKLGLPVFKEVTKKPKNEDNKRRGK